MNKYIKELKEKFNIDESKGICIWDEPNVVLLNLKTNELEQINAAGYLLLIVANEINDYEYLGYL